MPAAGLFESFAASEKQSEFCSALYFKDVMSLFYKVLTSSFEQWNYNIFNCMTQ